jgi:RNA polymerase-binding transcription factor DksA
VNSRTLRGLTQAEARELLRVQALGWHFRCSLVVPLDRLTDERSGEAEGGTMNIEIRSEHLRQVLESKLADTKRRIAMLKLSSEPEELHGGGDNTPLNELADATRAIEERDRAVEEEAQLRTNASLLQHAIARLRAGSYGTCERCKRPIARRRLAALPESTYCLDCEERFEASEADGDRRKGR